MIKNVPCLECEQCGEKYYTDAVAEKLETLIDMAKKMMQEIAVIDYQKAAWVSEVWQWSIAQKKTSIMTVMDVFCFVYFIQIN